MNRYKRIFKILISNMTRKQTKINHPEIVESYFDCNNKLITLKGNPEKVKGNFYCYNNMTTLDDALFVRIKYRRNREKKLKRIFKDDEIC
ncbi:MAG: hypothetical protein HPY57_14990 [Ignavibacteria bacterium]|nr:hypothetical protein [Ignavibacteria bacterium]